MKTLHIAVANKVATYQKRDGFLVCGNSDYQIEFAFDFEWDTFDQKVARFIYNGGYENVEFTGNICPVPVITNTTVVEVGVYIDGDTMSTTTGAMIPCAPSVLCDSSQSVGGVKVPVINGDSCYIRYSEHADGSSFTEEWHDGQIYIGIATGQNEPTDKSAYSWLPLGMTHTDVFGIVASYVSDYVKSDSLIEYTEGLEYALSDDGTYYILTGAGTAVNKYISGYDEMDGFPIYSYDPWELNLAPHHNGLPVQEITFSDTEGVSMVTSVTLPRTVKKLGGFKDCTRIQSVVIPDSVEIISSDAFNGCTNLASVTFGSGVKTIGASAFNGCTALASAVIPEGVTVIGDSAFMKCSSLASANIPVGVTSIGDNTFNGCVKLARVVIPAGVTSIGTSAFSGCKELTDVTFGGGVTIIGELAFNSCTALTKLSLPNSLTTIGNWAFDRCGGLVRAYIGRSVTSIGEGAFYSCNNLLCIELPNTLTSIGSLAFDQCYKLFEVINHSSLNITKGSSSNGKVAYYAMEVHSGTSKIDTETDYWFYPCGDTNYLIHYGGTGSSLDLVLPDSYKGGTYEVSNYAFRNRWEIKSITFGSGVTAIGESCCRYCNWLTTVSIGSVVKRIGSTAFADCTRLTEISCAFAEGAVEGAPWGATNANVSYLKYSEGLQYELNASGYTLTGIGDCTDQDLVIPSSYNGKPVTAIGDHALYCCSLNSVVVPDSVNTIGDWAVSECGVTTVVLGSGITSIVENAFAVNHGVMFYCKFAEGDVAGAPWGATESTVFYNY